MGVIEKCIGWVFVYPFLGGGGLLKGQKRCVYVSMLFLVLILFKIYILMQKKHVSKLLHQIAAKHTAIVGIFEQICCFYEVFFMALTSTGQLFIERPLYWRFLHNDHLPYFR